MENQLIKVAASQGIWTTLSIFLIFYILKVQNERDKNREEREKSYRDIIKNLTENSNIAEGIDKNLKNIRTDLEKLKNKD